jgi:hypothetical protein
LARGERLIDPPLKGDYGPPTDTSPIPENAGLQALSRLGYAGSDRVGSWVADPRAHGGGGNTKGGGRGKGGGGNSKGGGEPAAFDANWPATAEEREAWGKEGIAQVRAIVKLAKFDEVMVALRQHDEFTNKVIAPKYENILPPKGR